MVLVMTCGCFDLTIHPGHLQYLKKAKELGDTLIVLLNTDKWIMENKREPIMAQNDRKEMLESLGFVDYVIIFDTNEEKKDIILDLKPDFWIKASKDNEYNTKYDIVETETVESYGGRVIIIPSERDFSTTEIIKKVKNIDLIRG